MAHRTTCSLAIIATVLVSGSTLWSANTVAEVPFDLYQQHLVVTKGSIAHLNGLSLLIDTGTIPSVVDTRIARKLRLQTASSQLVRLRSAYRHPERRGGRVPNRRLAVGSRTRERGRPLLPEPWKGDKTVYYASGAARLLRLELRQVRLGTHTWDKLPAWALDRALDGYPDSIDGVLGVAALGCRRVRFDFERGELGWTR